MSDVYTCAKWRGEGTRESMTRDGLYDEGTVTKVEGRSVSWGDSWGFGGWPEDVPLPAVGDQIRFYGGIGRPVCGADVNGVNAYWITVEEEDRKHAEMRREMDERREREFMENEANLDAQYDALPPELQRRIDQLRGSGGRDWRVQNEGYEMFVCSEAVKIAALGSVEALDEFRALPYDEQKERVGMDDGHSGNTFGMACALARMLIEGRREAVVVQPQALSPLAGDPRYPA